MGGSSKLVLPESLLILVLMCALFSYYVSENDRFRIMFVCTFFFGLVVLFLGIMTEVNDNNKENEN